MHGAFDLKNIVAHLCFECAILDVSSILCVFTRGTEASTQSPYFWNLLFAPVFLGRQ